ncbi:MAG: hypothetical protein ABI443_04820 [Chthoniobacterales bacterium]
MPYADPEKRKEAKRRYYASRYAGSPKFRREEAKRKAAWYQENKEYCDAKTYARRAMIAEQKTKASRKKKKTAKKVTKVTTKKVVKKTSAARKRPATRSRATKKRTPARKRK